MFQTMKNAWKIPELKNKLLFTFLIIILYRLGANIPVPYVGVAGSLSTTGTILDFVNTLSGGAFAQATLFALGVSPYITASIVIQLLSVAIPYFERLAKDGQEGQKILSRWTRGCTVVLAIVTAIGYVFLLSNNNMLVKKLDFFVGLVLVSCFCAGTCLVMWLGEKINEFGIGNGISMILFANIIASFPSLLFQLKNFFLPYTSSSTLETEFGPWGIPIAIFVFALMLAMIVGIIWITDSERRIPINYAKRVVGRKQYGGSSQNLPIKLNMTGVMPIIFANAIVTIPATILAFIPSSTKTQYASTLIDALIGQKTWLYVLVFFLLIIAFAYFYVMISFNPVEVSNNIQQQGGQIRGIRPGHETVEHISKILNRVTLLGALFVCAIACIPNAIYILLGYIPGDYHFQDYFAPYAFLGSSIIIVVGVALETVRELEAQMSLRNYDKGFLG